VTISAHRLAALISGVLTFTIDVTNRSLPSLFVPFPHLPFPPRAGEERAGELAAENGQGGYFITFAERSEWGDPSCGREKGQKRIGKDGGAAYYNS